MSVKTQIELTKKYKTFEGYDVALYEIMKNQVFGRFKNHDGIWESGTWDTNGVCISHPTEFELVESEEVVITKICSIEPLTKDVIYLGASFTVPYDAEFMAIDSDGSLNSFDNKPSLGNTLWYDEHQDTIGLVEFDGDWKNSLRDI